MNLYSGGLKHLPSEKGIKPVLASVRFMEKDLFPSQGWLYHK